MPELPEVEAVRQVLGPQLAGRCVEAVSAARPEIIVSTSAREFCASLTGQTFAGIGRKEKFLILRLKSGDEIIVHLRMTGCLLLTPPDYPMEKHTHLIFRLDSGQELRFSDTRRFGRFWLQKKGEENVCRGMEKLGVDPLSSDFSADYLQGKLKKRKKAVKECLLDQSIVAGIGNIYSDEILFAAGVHPARPADTLTAEECGRLACLIPERLRFFIEKNRISAEDYLNTKGRDYRNTPYLQIYGHSGESCPVCGETLCRRFIGGRSSVFCPRCQKE